MKIALQIKYVLAVIVIGLFAAPLSLNAQTTNPTTTAAPSSAISEKQKAEIETIIREYLIKNPNVLREAFQALQDQEEAQKEQAASAAMKTHKAEIYLDPDSPFSGNPSADVSVVVFFDYFCGYCKKTLPALDELTAKDKSVKVIYKEFPILSPQSTVAARAALAAGRQGKYAEFHKALVAANNASEETLKGISDKLGLNYLTLQKDMKDPQTLAALARTRKLAQVLHIDGTPSYLVGDQFIPGAVDIEVLTKTIREEREKLGIKPEVK
jgi:protein-disulfide isomerase